MVFSSSSTLSIRMLLYYCLVFILNELLIEMLLFMRKSYKIFWLINVWSHLQKINEKPQIITDYEAGRGIPNQQILGKIERAIGIKLRGKDKGKPLEPPASKTATTTKKWIWSGELILVTPLTIFPFVSSQLALVYWGGTNHHDHDVPFGFVRKFFLVVWWEILYYPQWFEFWIFSLLIP